MANVFPLRLFFPLLVLALCSASLESEASSNQLPKLTGRVVDTANMISPSMESELSAIFAEHEEQTTNQVVVVTVKSWGGKTKEQYGYTLAREWSIGQKGKDNGIVLLISRDNREIRMEVGYGLEGTMTDISATQIIRRVIVPEFRKGNFDEGVKKGSIAIINILLGEEPSIPHYKKQTTSDPWTGPAQVFLFIILVTIIFGIELGPEIYLRRKWKREFPGVPYRMNKDGTAYVGSGYSGGFSGGGGFGGGGGGGSW